MNGPAFLVLGAESSGTRLVTQILIAGGCSGSPSHAQLFDAGVPAGPGPVTLRRSVPHGNRAEGGDRWLRLGETLQLFGGRPVHAVISARDWYCTAQSQVRTGHADSESEALSAIGRAYADIYYQVAVHDLVHTAVIYEALIQRPAAVQAWLWRRLGLPGGVPVRVRDENEKYWERR